MRRVQWKQGSVNAAFGRDAEGFWKCDEAATGAYGGTTAVRA